MYQIRIGALQLSKGEGFLHHKNDGTHNPKRKWSATEEAVVLSGVPVSQVQEDSVRDGGFKHRKLAQMACRSVPDAPPPSTTGQDVGKASLPPPFP